MVERKSILRSIDTVNLFILLASIALMCIYAVGAFTDMSDSFFPSAVLWMKICNRTLVASCLLQIVFCFIVRFKEGKFFFRYLIGALVKLALCFLPVILTTFTELLGSGFSIAF